MPPFFGFQALVCLVPPHFYAWIGVGLGIRIGVRIPMVLGLQLGHFPFLSLLVFLREGERLGRKEGYRK
jgi:hypothetical protein